MPIRPKMAMPMEKWSFAKNIGTGFLVGGVATGLLRGFDVWVIVISLLGAALLLAVGVRHALLRNP